MTELYQAYYQPHRLWTGNKAKKSYIKSRLYQKNTSTHG